MKGKLPEFPLLIILAFTLSLTSTFFVLFTFTFAQAQFLCFLRVQS